VFHFEPLDEEGAFQKKMIALMVVEEEGAFQKKMIALMVVEEEGAFRKKAIALMVVEEDGAFQKKTIALMVVEEEGAFQKKMIALMVVEEEGAFQKKMIALIFLFLILWLKIPIHAAHIPHSHIGVRHAQNLIGECIRLLQGRLPHHVSYLHAPIILRLFLFLIFLFIFPFLRFPRIFVYFTKHPIVQLKKIKEDLEKTDKNKNLYKT
jgi:hypothetical protein